MNARYRILSLGAGVQSTTLYLMACQGVIEPFDFAIFADTQEEPEAVYSHLSYLREHGSIPILVRTAGKLGDDLQAGVYCKNGTRFASIPAFTCAPEDKEVGMTRRQCTREYKLAVIERTIRREIIGLAPRQRMPKGVSITQAIGISLDEIGRSRRKRFVEHPPWQVFGFPLLSLRMTREECKTWLAERGNLPYEVPRSSCIFCPMQNDAEWLNIKAHPKEWARAVEIDEVLRAPGNVVNRKMDKPMYLHRSCVPLSEAKLRAPRDPREQLALSFYGECTGMCGL